MTEERTELVGGPSKSFTVQGAVLCVRSKREKGKDVEKEEEEEENEEEDEEEEDVILRWYTSSPVPGSDVPLTRHT
ncbi:hypothetical protein HZH66_007355 [Vespula vulgaris]|uniref:Uncharacterized protein n=1 Tax=Vespula vulgaris TaxID=7454 RepID=A0A834JXT2_VESVU|nr:hypothetical protein HZH66_007355 [Vespula vulgaris]